MNENLFTFPGGTADASGDNPFDLSGFTELTGNNTQNPFADLLAGGEATEQPPAEGAGAVQADDSIPEEKDETDQNHETVEEDESHEISKSPAPQDPQPKSPPAPKSEEDHASDKPEEAEDNPRLAAMERQEEKTAPKVAEPIFAQLPVFSYNGSEAPIEDTEQTFDELRLSKLTDFPEFDEAQSLSWKVVYGKIVKEIVLPKKTKIGQIKREIETSKEFINALKKATDKHPKCLVKPSISMQKKGDASAYTMIGASGIRLSGGERQRIAIARAIIKDAPIIVLDEATAFSDPENEYLIQKAFEKLIQNKTVIMIAHRLSTIRNADQILVMEHGQLIEQGTHDMAAAKAAYCDEFVMRLSDGYQTVLGENGSTLSGGERQRISIARALLKDAPIILLDEATASLDPENEVLIQRAIARLVEGKTVIMIAHRLRTVVDADQIFVLENGKLVERGTHDELIAHKGLYEKLYHIQQESLDWVV